MYLLGVSQKEAYVGAYMLQVDLSAEIQDVTFHTKNYFNFRLYQVSTNLFSSYIQSDYIEIEIKLLYLL